MQCCWIFCPPTSELLFTAQEWMHLCSFDEHLDRFDFLLQSLVAQPMDLLSCRPRATWWSLVIGPASSLAQVWEVKCGPRHDGPLLHYSWLAANVLSCLAYKCITLNISMSFQRQRGEKKRSHRLLHTPEHLKKETITQSELPRSPPKFLHLSSCP